MRHCSVPATSTCCMKEVYKITCVDSISINDGEIVITYIHRVRHNPPCCLTHACITCRVGLPMHALPAVLAYPCMHYLPCWLTHACIICSSGDKPRTDAKLLSISTILPDIQTWLFNSKLTFRLSNQPQTTNKNKNRRYVNWSTLVWKCTLPYIFF